MFKSYLRFWHDKIYYRKTYSLNQENVPADGTPLLIVSNHQNCLNDPLGIVFSFRDRKPNVIARADVFALHPLVNKFLRSIGLLPAFRLKNEGMESLKSNQETFRVSEQALLDGSTVVMYPEAGHQNKRWLGTFSFGYTKLAFEAAEIGNFEKDIKILPACNHYSRYFGLRTRFMVRFGTPISIQPYYELYKTKPRTAQREVNKLVRAQISSMMLNMTDLDNYTTIDFIRNTYGLRYAESNGIKLNYLPDLLESDKKLFARLDACKAENEAEVQGIYDDAARYSAMLKESKIDDAAVGRKSSACGTLIQMLAQLILLPVWIYSLVPSILMFYIPLQISKRMHDPMFRGSFLYAINVLFLIPGFGLLTLLLDGFLVNWIYALVHVLLFPLMFIFAWDYKEWVVRTWKSFRKIFVLGKDRRNELNSMRNDIFDRIDKIVK